MGIPKFYRYISERWPLITQVISDDKQIPEFDNLYLDMNSILHNCTHSDDDTLSRLTEEQMFTSICAYIDHLFHVIKPQKLFYMAVDGVAPRAKMNQQRARRFRTAMDAEKNLAKAIADGLEIPKEDAFDSNAITPGTEFMASLTKNLKYFIHKKISSDSKWQNIKVILSGHEVPGEGEHKIMEYIKTMKAQPKYNPNLRHCIYGLDADLIMLGLVSHDPHFALLREEVTFGRNNKKKSSDLDQQQFNLLHISLVREYMALEFADVAEQLSFEYNFERILDDFILIMYVIGNDFLPNLPDLFINKGAFPLLIETFKQALRQCDGYINENGTINLPRLGIWLDYLARFELQNFEQEEVDVEWFNKQLENISVTGEKKREKQGKMLILRQQKKLIGMIKPWLMNVLSRKIDMVAIAEDDSKIPSLLLPTDEVKTNLEFIKQFALDVGLILVHSQSKDTYTARLDIDGINPHESDEEFDSRVDEVRKVVKKYQAAILIDDEEVLEESKDIYDSKFVKWKDQYYKNKLGFSIHDEEEMTKLTENYVEGLQWVLYYYYTGCASWNWYYKYHYSPRISDIKRGLDALIHFDKGKPFRPNQQLMAVLPARSKKLIPACYRPLMTDEKSPIIDFYPNEVEIDKNGKTADWEAVVKISFVDQDRLVETMLPYDEKLSLEEKKRNSYGTDLLFTFNPQVERIYPTPMPSASSDIEHDHCIENHFALPSLDGLEFISGLPEGAKLGVELLAGFPSLHNIPFKSRLSLNGTVVFQQPSRSESVILTIDNLYQEFSVEQFAQKYAGKIVYTRWPYLREAKVVRIVDEMFKYEQIKMGNGKRVVSSPLEDFERKEFKNTKDSIGSGHVKTKGVELGRIEGLVYVKPVTGLIRNQQGAYVKTFDKNEEVYPIQLIVKSVVNDDERYRTRPAISIEEEYPVDSQAVCLGDFGYGSPIKVIGHSPPNKLNVEISSILKGKEPTIGHERVSWEKRTIENYPSFTLAKYLHIPPLFLSKITSSYMVTDDKGKRINVGLELKFDARREKVLGYANKTDRYWEYSSLAAALLDDYGKKFPQVFANLKNSTTNFPTIKEVFKIANPQELDKKVKELTDYLKKTKSEFIRVSLESDSLTRFSIQAIENSIEQYVSQGEIAVESRKIRNYPREAIIDPSVSYQYLSTQRFNLGDRVIYVQKSGKVPYLMKGTVVGVTSFGAKISLQIVFDYPFISGTTLDGRLRTNRGLSVDSSLVLNVSTKQFVYHSKASKSQTNGAKKPTGKPITNGKPSVKVGGNAPASVPAVAAKKSNEEKGRVELLSILKHKGEEIKADNSSDKQDDEDIKNPKAREHLNKILGGLSKPPISQESPVDVFPNGGPIYQSYPVPPLNGIYQQQPINLQGTQDLRNILHDMNGLKVSNGEEINGRGRGGRRGNGRGGRGARGGAPRGRGKADFTPPIGGEKASE